MEQNLEAQIEKRLHELPEDIHAAVMAADLDKKVQAIGAKYQLHIDQMGLLGDEILLAMLGFTELDKLGEHIQTQVTVAPDVAGKIVQDASEQIFMPIRASLVQFGETQKAPARPVPVETPKLPEEKLLPAAEKMLTEKTVTPLYKTDPYREPVE